MKFEEWPLFEFKLLLTVLHFKQKNQSIAPTRTELMKNCSIAKSSSDQQPFSKNSDSMRTDISDGSTNTDDYITCTDASKRGTTSANVTSSSITQPPPPPGLHFKPNSKCSHISYTWPTTFVAGNEWEQSMLCVFVYVRFNTFSLVSPALLS